MKSLILLSMILVGCGSKGGGSSAPAPETVQQEDAASSIEDYEIISISVDLWSEESAGIDAKSNHPNIFASAYEVIILISPKEIKSCDEVNEDTLSEISPYGAANFSELEYDTVYHVRACVIDPVERNITHGKTAKFKTKPMPDYLKDDL